MSHQYRKDNPLSITRLAENPYTQSNDEKTIGYLGYLGLFIYSAHAETNYITAPDQPSKKKYPAIEKLHQDSTQHTFK